jgi:hypothetical protein
MLDLLKPFDYHGGEITLDAAHFPNGEAHG